MACTPISKWAVHPISRFGDFSPAWDSLNRHAGAVPFMFSIFVRHALAQFGRGDEWLAVLGPEAEPSALAIVSKKRAGIWETFQPSQMPLGAWLMRPGVEYATAGRQLLRALPGFGLLLAITQQDPALHGRPLDGATLRTIDYIKTGRIELHGTFEEYWRGRGKGLRQNMRTQRARLARGNLSAQLEMVTDVDDVEAVVREYARLESGGWKGKEGTAVEPNSKQGRFYLDVLRDYCRAGMGRVFVYRFDDRAVAIDLNIEFGDVMVLLKTTYDESLQGFSPSSMMREDLLRVLFREGRIRRLEFFGPAMEWTYRWTDAVRTLFHVNVYRYEALCAVHKAMRSRAC